MADFWFAAYFAFVCSGLDNGAKFLTFLRQQWPFALFRQGFLDHTNYSKLFCLSLLFTDCGVAGHVFSPVIKSFLSLQVRLFSFWVFAGQGGNIIFPALSFWKQ